MSQQITLYTDKSGKSLNEMEETFWAWGPGTEDALEDDYSFTINKDLVKEDGIFIKIMTTKPIDFKPYQTFQK